MKRWGFENSCVHGWPNKCVCLRNPLLPLPLPFFLPSTREPSTLAFTSGYLWRELRIVIYRISGLLCTLPSSVIIQPVFLHFNAIGSHMQSQTAYFPRCPISVPSRLLSGAVCTRGREEWGKQLIEGRYGSLAERWLIIVDLVSLYLSVVLLRWLCYLKRKSDPR